MEKYITIDKYLNGDIIKMIILDLHRKYNFTNILFVRTHTTGAWMDDLMIDKEVSRIIYYVDKTKKNNSYNKSSISIDSADLETTLMSMGKKYDLIAIDPFHEYYESKRDLNLLSSFLTDSGILISHDCYPKSKEMAYPHFNEGGWCGETYIAFVEFAYNNPNIFYAVLNTDTGIGIISKSYFEPLKNNLNIEKQKKLLFLHKESDDAYTYFSENSDTIINAIHSNK